MTKKQKIISSYSHLTANGTAKACGVSRVYVYRIWNLCEIPLLRNINFKTNRI